MKLVGTDGKPALSIARLWVEFEPQLGPGETADVRLALRLPRMPSVQLRRLRGAAAG
ncbi:hypothetical protein ACFVTY_03115 [Streptomyces sp. NPDC058067]|uniref:hypothetical protein n=1 Tax=Streptomyces sp. NPDC058067 TaxID=3346324 RepID=UPI0036F06977